MKKCSSFFLMVILLFIYTGAAAQCAMCTKTAQQLGEKPALGMNSGILYLMFIPFLIMGFIAYRWWKNRINTDEETVGNG
jgi:hypothetical protein